MKKYITFIAVLFVSVIFTTTSAYGGEEHVIIQQDSATVFPIIIDQRGSYLLVTDLYLDDSAPHAILINSDSVSLNLGGHTISADSPPNDNSGYGIAAFNRKNISVNPTVA